MRRRLGLRPGSDIEWEEQPGGYLVRRARKVSFEEIRKVLFPEGPPKRQSLKQLLLEQARAAGNLPLGTFNRTLAQASGAVLL